MSGNFLPGPTWTRPPGIELGLSFSGFPATGSLRSFRRRVQQRASVHARLRMHALLCCSLRNNDVSAVNKRKQCHDRLHDSEHPRRHCGHSVRPAQKLAFRPTGQSRQCLLRSNLRFKSRMQCGLGPLAQDPDHGQMHPWPSRNGGKKASPSG